MTALLHALGLRGVLLVGTVLAIGALTTHTVVQSNRLDAARASLATAESDLAAARATADRLATERAAAMQAVADERAKADAYARSAQALRDQIARDAGGDRDGPTAPVLRDAIRGIEKTFATTLARRAGSWALTVIVAGRVERIVAVPNHAACVAAVMAVAAEIRSRPTFASDLKGRVLLICRQSDGRIA